MLVRHDANAAIAIRTTDECLIADSIHCPTNFPTDDMIIVWVVGACDRDAQMIEIYRHQSRVAKMVRVVD